MSYYNENVKKAVNKYKAENYKRVPLDLPISFVEQFKAHAKERGESVNGFIRRAIETQLAIDAAEKE